MVEKRNAVVLPDDEDKLNAAREVLDLLRHKGYPIRFAREILELARDRLEWEPLCFPKAVYKLKGEA